jgi:hypothetical protein
MNALIEVYRMDEVSVKTRIRLLKKLSTAINFQYGANVTEELVIELILLLDKNYSFQNDEHLLKYL